MFCMKCGTKLPDDAMFCYKCGSKINTNFNSDGASSSVVSETPDSNNTVEEKLTTEEYIELAEKEYQEYLNCKNSDADLIREEAGNHKTQAISFFKNAGVKGEFQLAKHYMEENTPDELTAAMKIFKKLGDEGDSEAYYNLGLCYDSGDNKNIEQAKIWLLKADELGHVDALKMLGRLYYKSYKESCEKKDLQNALNYYDIAVKRKDIIAMLELAKIAKEEDGREGLTVKQCEQLCNDVLSVEKDNAKAIALLAKIARERQEEKERLEREVTALIAKIAREKRKKEEQRKREAERKERERIEAEKRYRSPYETKKRIENVIVRTMHGFVIHYIIELGKEGSKNTTFYLGDIDSSKLYGAKRTYIKPKSAKIEEVIFLYDNTLMGDGEEGFALTPYGLTSSKFRKCIPYHLIEEVILEGGFVKDIFVKLKSGSIIEFSPISKCETEIVKLLNEIIHNKKCITDSELLINSIGKDDESRNDILFLNDEEPVESEEVLEEKKNIINDIVRKYYRFVDGSLKPNIKDEDIQKVIQSYGAGLRLNEDNIIYLSQNCDFVITAAGLASDVTPELIRFSDIKKIIFSDDNNKIGVEKNNGHIEDFGTFYRGPAVGRMLEELQCTINHKEYKDEIKPFDSTATLTDIVKEVTTHNSYKFEKWFYVYPNIPQKKINNVLDSYAENTDLRSANIYLLYDRTLIGSAKDGFVITDKGLVSSEHKELIPFSIISSAYRSNEDVKRIHVKLKDGSDCYFAYNRIFPSLSNDIADIINTIVDIATKCGLFDANSTLLENSSTAINQPAVDNDTSNVVEENDFDAWYDSNPFVNEDDSTDFFVQGKDFFEQRNYDEALKCFKSSAEQGNADAQDMLGQMYRQVVNGMEFNGIPGDFNIAFSWLKKAAEQNHLLGLFHLGEMYQAGAGCQKDNKKAINLFENAANQGCVEAQTRLGWIYQNGDCGLAKDYEKSVKWYQKAAEQGDAGAQNMLGNRYYSGEGVAQDYNEAVKWYQKGAVQGNADAQGNLAYMYYKGYGVTQDYTEAVKWYQKAAEQGNARAQNALGTRYFGGQGVAEDYNEAVKWYQKAAEQGHDGAQSNLAYMYYKGYGVTQDYAEALKWYKKAAEQGYDDAQYHLGLMYRDGEGVRQDNAEAAKWLRKAAEQGHADAQNKLQALNNNNNANNDNNNNDSSCFITTAVCGSLNKPDDCDELMSMRWLRDKLLVEDSDMAVLIEEYYRVAPLVVKKIDSKADAPVVYNQLWENSISKIYGDIKQKDYKDAKLRYMTMLEDLCARYDEPLANGIKERIEKVKART